MESSSAILKGINILYEIIQHPCTSGKHRDKFWYKNILLLLSWEFRCHADIMNIAMAGLVQERRNSIANALELCLSCTKPSIATPIVEIRWLYESLLSTAEIVQLIIFIMNDGPLLPLINLPHHYGIPYIWLYCIHGELFCQKINDIYVIYLLISHPKKLTISVYVFHKKSQPVQLCGF